jgi:NAD+ synthetase
MPVLDPQALITDRVKAIQGMHADAGTPKAEIDVSGGLDSAVLVLLLAQALGPENVIAVHSGINTNPDQTARAREVCEVAGVKLVVINITETYEALVTDMVATMSIAGYGSYDEIMARCEANPTILGSIRSCIRAPIGRGYNRLFGGGLRHGTGNECEDRWMRFYQKGGDGEVDSNPVAMLSKGEVFQLARALGCPRSILEARPSPDLWGKGDGHNDEDEIGDYLGFKAADYGQTFYSYIDLDTGEYSSVGLIERVARLDDYADIFEIERAASVDFTQPPLWDKTIESPFAGIDRELMDQLLTAARRVERATRHKFNPNCPSLGDRETLLAANSLTNTLPLL